MSTLAGILGFLLAAGPDGERLRCIADTTISIHEKEQAHTRGGKSTIRLKGIEDLALLDFDVAPIKGRKVEEARIFLKVAGKNMLKLVGLSTVSAPWKEGKGNGPARPGDSCFLAAEFGRRPWAYPGSDFLAVAFGQGGSIWFVREIRAENDGWISIDVPPPILHALAEGASYGIALSDEKGETRNNNNLYSRDQSRGAPYITVRTGEGPAPASGAKAYAAAPPPGEEDRSGAFLKAYAPAVKPPSVRLADGCRVRILAESATDFDAPAAGRAWDGRALSLDAARGEHLGFIVAVEIPAGEARAVSFSGDGWKARRLLSVGKTFDPLVPAGAEVKGRALYHVERYVPKTAEPGARAHPLTLSTGSVDHEIPALLRVHRAQLPDRLGYKISLNAYRSGGRLAGDREGSPAHLAMERATHRLAHEHRTTFNVVPYSQRGRVDFGFAPKLKREGGAAEVASWKEWDARWTPYFDGSAFEGLPRGGTPLDHFYLPLHENWPLPINEFYSYKGKTEDHWRHAPAIEEGFPDVYGRGFSSMAAEMARHVQEKGWKATEFHVYLNNKPYIRTKRGESEGAWWCLDEPVTRDDFLALAYYARLAKAGIGRVPGAPVRFRIDLSRPQWRRHYLDGLVDLNVVNGRYARYPRYVFGRGEEVWVYGGVPVSGTSAQAGYAWVLQTFLDGADGTMPWNTLGGSKAWTTPESTALILPPRPGTEKRPHATLRLKMLRRAQQDVELLRLVMAKRKLTRAEVRRGIAEFTGLKGEYEQTHADDAGRVNYAGLDPDRFEAFRRALRAALD